MQLGVILKTVPLLLLLSPPAELIPNKCPLGPRNQTGVGS